MSTTNKDPSKPETIQDIAFKLAEEQLQQLQLDNGPRERTVFILGSKNVGKTTAINSFFDREETPRPTLALDYSYARKTAAVQKQICHIWELGSLDRQLAEVPLRSQGVENLSCIIMVDLSQPQRLWCDLKESYEILRNYCDKLMVSKGDDDVSEREDKMRQRVKKDHVDLATLNVMPFPVIIVGGKYDLYIGFEPEIKKHICRCLRSMAHLMGGGLLFYSNKLQKLAKTLRDTISHLAFGSPSHPFRSHNTDYNDALSIWYGNDTWDNISSMGVQTLQSIESNINEEIPQDFSSLQQEQKHQDPAKDPGFRESVIDEMRAQKDEELRLLVKNSTQKMLRGKFESVK
ncbi:cytoplasmic dynein 2 light intermediate chain 1-like [Musca domestica]|uniref:Cytoplasmic dynein 2 light intermediate chain 1 n=1 Tax=Musca domestica TaxID=7370 RepID=A0A1I8MYR4_MUSDO|nr:cytoplasmic dynein 2 light intermediate chain 1-like [Musca domestica]